jgi:formylglycine-generating enzyme required for sulfatase activity
VTATCDSCGRDDEDVFAVHRVYVTPATWETAGSVRRLDTVEQWCFACRAHYPHESADAGAADQADG